MYNTNIDFNSDAEVITATVYGEIRGGNQEAWENVIQVFLKRKELGYAPTLRAVCLQPWQFSCWNPMTVHQAPSADFNAMMAAKAKDQVTWSEIEYVVLQALAGKNPNRIGAADSYYANTIRKPYWAAPPAYQTYADNWHKFWRVRYLNKA